MSEHASPDYKELLRLEKQRREQAEERQKQAEERQKQAEERQKRVEEQNRPTTLIELLRHCHNLLSLPVKVETPSRSTAGTIPLPTGKYCPTRLELWEDCESLQVEVYRSVLSYLQPAAETAPRLFAPLIELEGLSRRFVSQPINSEQGLEFYERAAVDVHVRDIITELGKIPAAREEFGLGDDLRFDNHTNGLSRADATEAALSQSSSIRRPRPDQFCIHNVDGDKSILLTSGEYKPPHKLPVNTIRLGLRPMKLWGDLVRSRKIPTDEKEKLKYNAERLVCSAIVQQYHVMIQEGLAVSYMTNGICEIHLWIPHDDPGTLHYYMYDPNTEVSGYDRDMLEPKTAIARRLCLYLMSYRHSVRSQQWRNDARACLHIWQTSFDHVRSQIPDGELAHVALHSDNTEPDYMSAEPSSDYQPSSSPVVSPTPGARRVATRSQSCRAPLDGRRRSESPDASGSDENPPTSKRKRGFSEVSSSSSARQTSTQHSNSNSRDSNHNHHNAQFCTLKCLLGLQLGDPLDERCPNVKLHRQDQDDPKHPIDVDNLLLSIKGQLDQSLDLNITPFGQRGESGAPFKVTCAQYGYTVVGKGTTSDRWAEVAAEAEVYRILKKAQGSAVPVFLGPIDLEQPYFLHGAGDIQHMLIMAWGGEGLKENEISSRRREIKRSRQEIEHIGVTHQDFRRENILWNAECQRILIIDFNRSAFRPRLPKDLRRSKRTSSERVDGIEPPGWKRVRVL